VPARRAARVQVEQFGGDVADALRRLAARLLPLVAAELVQRRGLGRRAGVADTRCSACTGTYSLSPSRIFEHQELAGVAGDVHGLQPT
jgi:hypothetical protein